MENLQGGKWNICFVVPFSLDGNWNSPRIINKPTYLHNTNDQEFNLIPCLFIIVNFFVFCLGIYYYECYGCDNLCIKP